MLELINTEANAAPRCTSGADVLDRLLDDVLAAVDVEDDGAVALDGIRDQFADPLDAL